MRAMRLLAAFLLLAVAAPASRAATVLVEAESLADCGGWVMDQQAMDQMGSAYLLAHGLGTPVRDAVGTVAFSEPGEYRVFVRTRDWVAPWNVEGAPGRFQVLVDGRPLDVTFGTEGAAWHWRPGGSVRIEGPTARVALHDLTGFDGRCDAIVFTTSASLRLPNDDPAMAEFRRQTLGLAEGPEDAGHFDFVVVGGGMAGTCAAISAARLGLDVALIQNRPVLGGNNSSEVRVGLSGRLHQEPYPALGQLVDEVGPVGHWNIIEAKEKPDDPRSREILRIVEEHPEKKTHNAGPASNYEDDKKLRAARAEKTLHLFLSTHVFRAEREGSRITAVVAKEIPSGRELRFAAPLFADCTGDGNLGFLAKADYRIGRESREETGESLAPPEADQLVMGTSVQWYSVEEDRPSGFPECPWAVQFNDQTCQRLTRGDWDWETGMHENQVTEIERIRDYALRVVYGNWSYLKSHDPSYANRRLAWVAYIGGKRESRRLMGDVVLCQQDIQGRVPYADACVTTTWGIDLHYPAPQNSEHFPGEEFRSIAKTVRVKPYAIPFRVLYSRNVPNLMMAGRNISVTHVALGTVRVQRTTGMMGEVVGMAASLCRKHEADPHDVYDRYLAELKELMRRGVPRSTAGQ